MSVGTYAAASVLPESRDIIAEYVYHIGIPNPLDPELYHCTIMYSRKPHPDFEPIEYGKLQTQISHFLIFPSRCPVDGSVQQALVAVLDSPMLEARHHHIREVHGATYDYPSYIPHITLSYDVGEGFDLEGLPVLDTKIYLSGEYAEDINEDYLNTL